MPLSATSMLRLLCVYGTISLGTVAFSQASTESQNLTKVATKTPPPTLAQILADMKAKAIALKTQATTLNATIAKKKVAESSEALNTPVEIAPKPTEQSDEEVAVSQETASAPLVIVVELDAEVAPEVAPPAEPTPEADPATTDDPDLGMDPVAQPDPIAEPVTDPVAEALSEVPMDPPSESEPTIELVIEIAPEGDPAITAELQSSEGATAQPLVMSLVVLDPFANPATFLAEIARRYSAHFGSKPISAPVNIFDFDDFSIELQRWSQKQNRILCQPVAWTVRVIRTEASKNSSERVLVSCQAVSADGAIVGDPFIAEMDRSSTADMIQANPRATIFTLEGTIDSRLAFSAEHEADGEWTRSGAFVAPYCVSNWVVNGQRLSLATATATPDAEIAVEIDEQPTESAEKPTEVSPSDE